MEVKGEVTGYMLEMKKNDVDKTRYDVGIAVWYRDEADDTVKSFENQTVDGMETMGIMDGMKDEFIPWGELLDFMGEPRRKYDGAYVVFMCDGTEHIARFTLEEGSSFAIAPCPPDWTWE